MDPLAAILPADQDSKTAVVDANNIEALSSDNCTLASGHSTSTVGHSRQSSLSELQTTMSCFEGVSSRLKSVFSAKGQQYQEQNTRLIEKVSSKLAAPAKSETEPGLAEKKKANGHQVAPGKFEQENHFYPRVLNAQIHPLVASFFGLGNERIIARYAHLRPMVDQDKLRELLNYRPKYFSWAGSDLFNVTTSTGQHQMIVVETNSCPSGQKSMPLLQESDEFGGYRVVIRSAFRDLLEDTECDGDLAVVYDKNPMEASGYAAVLAEESGEHVWLVEFHDTDADPPVRWKDRVMLIRDSSGKWHRIRACFRYITQRPWNRIPIHTRTRILNPVIACLAGGRNKMMAARAYEIFNSELREHNLSVRAPLTAYNVVRDEIPMWIESMGGHAVIKDPYSNAGQGVWTITNEKDLDSFMSLDHRYDKFIVQSLVGNSSWSSTTQDGCFYHVGTIPNKNSNIFVSDIRMMVAAASDGFRPVSTYARRARNPLIRRLEDDPDATSWGMLGTNLSVRNSDGSWSTESQRLMLMDRKDFNQLGIGIDELIDGYIQTVLSVIAIDKMCQRLVDNDRFDCNLFRTLNPDEALISEITL
ncbi:hypothetical protein IW140_000967 [Coemansia sp. RSA 1813]|nr:hypothetical protein EV178_004807 [Coemansia sp. RSA 1646]KAJ1773363.1 hypothetical protein LPJ74_000616 [Coemansia sp. RSA 1843]KAJ2091581.1 hypothetical protein IW138_001809 [Coemansia sp. RSA 986]KAJ2212368.1 hypothetical protein EV179_004693 [Coemansia sp. RSA 487]KAJ2572218.1 hypothetical protein IW140_000967 [Coemansia sp. RSA 1813]